jgi:hypothetical protein
MDAARARGRILQLTAEAVADPARAGELAAEIAELGQSIRASQEVIGPFEPPVRKGVCFFHRQVCKRHQICNAHPKEVVA